MKARSILVRWILVITLGCSLGLLLVYVVGWFRPMPTPTDGGPNIYVTHKLESKPPEFRLSETEIESELRQVIEAQLAAFRQDDYPEAYKYAATSIKAQFPLPAFERMVKQGFPSIAQSTSAQFGVVVDNGKQAVVNVAVVGASGRTRHYQYLMQREGAGWRIFGVTEVKSTGTAI
jgi:hypothetical protein